MATFTWQKVNETEDSRRLLYNFSFQWNGQDPAFSSVQAGQTAVVDGVLVGNADRDTAFAANTFNVASNQLIDVSALLKTKYGKAVESVRLVCVKGSGNGWQDGANGFSIIDSEENVYFTFPLKGDFNVKFDNFIKSDEQTNANGDLFLRPLLEPESFGIDVWNQSIHAQVEFEKVHED